MAKLVYCTVEINGNSYDSDTLTYEGDATDYNKEGVFRHSGNIHAVVMEERQGGEEYNLAYAKDLLAKQHYRQDGLEVPRAYHDGYGRC